jgi:hypothetical protein
MEDLIHLAIIIIIIYMLALTTCLSKTKRINLKSMDIERKRTKDAKYLFLFLIKYFNLIYLMMNLDSTTLT